MRLGDQSINMDLSMTCFSAMARLHLPDLFEVDHLICGVDVMVSREMATNPAVRLAAACLRWTIRVQRRPH
jgi:hypothetical protein